MVALQVPLLPHLAVDPQVHPTRVGRPGDAVVGPVLGIEAVRHVDILVADPEAHLPRIRVDGDRQLVVAAVAGVRDDGVDPRGPEENMHADREGVQIHAVEGSQSIADGVSVFKVEHQRKEFPVLWRRNKTKNIFKAWCGYKADGQTVR